MKIKNTDNTSVKFATLHLGDVFMESASIYLKTERAKHDGGLINAVNLANGGLCVFDDNKDVYLVDAELVIN